MKTSIEYSKPSLGVASYSLLLPGASVSATRWMSQVSSTSCQSACLEEALSGLGKCYHRWWCLKVIRLPRHLKNPKDPQQNIFTGPVWTISHLPGYNQKVEGRKRGLQINSLTGSKKDHTNLNKKKTVPNGCAQPGLTWLLWFVERPVLTGSLSRCWCSFSVFKQWRKCFS